MAGKSAVATPPPSPASISTSAAFLNRQKWSHEVALTELNSLHSSRFEPPSNFSFNKGAAFTFNKATKEAVYQKNGNLYFRTNIQQAIASEQRHLDTTKAKLQKLYSPS